MTTTSDFGVVAAVAAAWSAWSDERDFPFSPDCCINGSRVAIGALGHLGVRARPVSVHMTLFNSFAWDLYRAGVPVAEWPEHAWSLGVGPGHPTKLTRFTGHLVVEGDDWTLDVSARQFDRPGLLRVPEPWLIDHVLPSYRTISEVELPGGQMLVLGRWPTNDAWRFAPGWRPHPAEVDELTRRAETLLERSTS